MGCVWSSPRSPQSELTPRLARWLRGTSARRAAAGPSALPPQGRRGRVALSPLAHALRELERIQIAAGSASREAAPGHSGDVLLPAALNAAGGGSRLLVGSAPVEPPAARPFGIASDDAPPSLPPSGAIPMHAGRRIQ